MLIFILFEIVKVLKNNNNNQIEMKSKDKKIKGNKREKMKIYKT